MIITKEKLRNPINLLTGFLCFSPYYTHLPNPLNSFELWMFVFLIFNSHRLNWRFNSQLVIWVFGYIVLFALGANYLNVTELTEFYQMGRQWALIILFSYIACRTFMMNIDNLYWISLGAVIGGIAMGIDGLSVLGLGGHKTLYLCPTIPAMPICASISFFRSKKIRAISFLALATQAGLSQTRGIILYVIVIYAISWFIYSAFYKGHIFNRSSIIISLGFILALVVYTFMEDIVKSTSSYLHYRLYTKMQNISTTHEDQSRINQYLLYVNNYDEYILPHGFYLRRGASEWGRTHAKGVNDSGYLELVWTFGYLIFFIIMYHFFKQYRRIYHRRKHMKIEDFMLFVTSTFTLFAPLMGYMIWKAPFSACFWGIYIALLRTYNNNRIDRDFRRQLRGGYSEQ